MIERIRRNLFYRFKIKPYERKNSSQTKYNKSNKLALFSNPRGGSTWVMEIFQQAISESFTVLEPLFRGLYHADGKMPVEYKTGMWTEKLNFWHYQPIMEQEEWPEAELFFGKLFNREMLPLSVIYENDIYRIRSKKNQIVKFCYGNLLLPWVARNFDVSCVHLIRHPGAVIASQLAHGSWKHFKNNSGKMELPEFRNVQFYAKYEQVIQQIDNPVKHLAFLWAITNQTLLEHESHRNWLTLTYEDMLMNPHKTMNQLISQLENSVQGISDEALRRPSKTTLQKEALKVSNPEAQLEKWRAYLSEKQIDDAQSILEMMNVKYYSMYDVLPK